MKEEKNEIENEIYSLCDAIYKLNQENIKKNKNKNISDEKIVFVTKKIHKFKTYISNSELICELYSKKNILKEKLNIILNAENAIKQIINDDPDNTNEIENRYDSIIHTIEDMEPTIISLIDLTTYMPRDGIKNNVKLYRRELDKMSNSFAELQERVNVDFAEIKENEEKEVSQINSKQEELNTSINNQFADFNKKIEEAQSIINQKELEIESIKENYVKETEQLKKSYSDELNQLKEQTNKDFDELKIDIEKKDKKISELIGLIGNKANIGEYKSNADKAHKERIIWQISTVIIFIIAFGMMCVITLKTKDYNITTLARYIVSVILLGMSGYTAKQASNQRKDEIYFRKQQLELSSMDVYLDDMPANIKQEIKQTLSNKIFGQARETYKSKYDESSNSLIEKLVNLVEELTHRQK